MKLLEIIQSIWYLGVNEVHLRISRYEYIEKVRNKQMLDSIMEEIKADTEMFDARIKVTRDSILIEKR